MYKVVKFLELKKGKKMAILGAYNTNLDLNIYNYYDFLYWK